jgi:hypothetical protein
MVSAARDAARGWALVAAVALAALVARAVAAPVLRERVGATEVDHYR